MTALLFGLILVATARGQTAQYDFSMDLFLVGHNGPAMRDWDWIDQAGHRSPIQDRLASDIDKLPLGGSYMIVVEGIRPPALDESETLWASYFMRVPSGSEVKHGLEQAVGRSRVRYETYERTFQDTFGIFAPPAESDGTYGPSAQLDPCPFPERLISGTGRGSISLEDLSEIGSDRSWRDGSDRENHCVVLSGRSIAETIRLLGPMASAGVSLCEGGTSDQKYPNVVPFPPGL